MSTTDKSDSIRKRLTRYRKSIINKITPAAGKVNIDDCKVSKKSKYINTKEIIERIYLLSGIIKFIIIVTSSLFMQYMMYSNIINANIGRHSLLQKMMYSLINTNNGNIDWNTQFIIFIISMIMVPVLFILIRMNIIILHNSYYADYMHYLLIFVFMIFFLFVTYTVIMQDGNNNDISSSTMSTLLLISYIIIHFFIFNLTSRFWIFFYAEKFDKLLVLWLLTMIAFIFSIIIFVYWHIDDYSNFDIFYYELYLLRSYYILLWLVVLTYLHLKQFKSQNKSILILLSIECILFALLIPTLFLIFGIDTDSKKDLLNYLVNGLILFCVIQLILIWIICTSQTNIVCLISLPLIIVQSVSLCFYMDSSSLWRKIDAFGGCLVLWIMFILTLCFAVIPSSVFSNFWQNVIFSNFLFLDLSSLQILYNASRIKQIYGGLNINKRFLSLSSDIIAPWTVNYKQISSQNPSYDLCANLVIGIKTTTLIHFNSKLKQQSLWRKVFCWKCDRKKIEERDIKYNYYYDGKQKDNDNDDNDDGDDEEGESLEIHRNSLDFTDFYPTKFANIRAWNGLSSELYIKTFSKSLLEFITNSKSGMYFFYTSNGKFLIKSLKKSEYYFFVEIFNEYYKYLKQNQNTLINRFYGMYAIQNNNDLIYFIVMESIFYSNLNVDTIYDLKGSTKGRIATEKDKKEKIEILKDLDWKNGNKQINIGEKPAILYREQLKNDTLFLQSLKIMDYSLLVGIHNVNYKNQNNLYELNDRFHNKLSSPYLFTFCHRGMIGRDKKKIYFSGIIDILQKYNTKKKVENVMRRISGNNQAEISCAPPHLYANRINHFLKPCIL